MLIGLMQIIMCYVFSSRESIMECSYSTENKPFMHDQVAAVSKLSMQAHRDRRITGAIACMAQYASLAAVEPAQGTATMAAWRPQSSHPYTTKQYS